MQGAITEDTTPADPTPDIYEQMLQIYNSLKTDFSNMLTKLGEKSTVSDERNISTFWQSLEYLTKYMDTDLRQLLNQAISNSSTQGVMDLINESVIPKFAEVKNKIETEATAVKNEILDNKALMYLQAAQISPNTYQMNEKRFLEFINIKECRDLYISDYSALDNKLLSPAVRLKVAGNLLNLICGTSMFLDVNGKVNDTSNNYSNPNHYEKFMYNTVSKIKKLYAAHKNFIERQKLDKLHYVSPLVTKRYTAKKLTASTTDTATVTYNGRGLLLGCFAHHSSNINDWYNFRGVAFPNGSTGSDKPLSIKSILVDGVAPQKIPYIDTGDFRINNSLEFNSSIQVIFSGSGYSENVYGGIAIMPY